MTRHLSSECLGAYVRGELPGLRAGAVEVHVAACVHCGRRLQLEAQLELELSDLAQEVAANSSVAHGGHGRPAARGVPATARASMSGTFSRWAHCAGAAVAAAFALIVGAPGDMAGATSQDDAIVAAFTPGPEPGCEWSVDGGSTEAFEGPLCTSSPMGSPAGLGGLTAEPDLLATFDDPEKAVCAPDDGGDLVCDANDPALGS
jgi:hypothetical protein